MGFTMGTYKKHNKEEQKQISVPTSSNNGFTMGTIKQKTKSDNVSLPTKTANEIYQNQKEKVNELQKKYNEEMFNTFSKNNALPTTTLPSTKQDTFSSYVQNQTQPSTQTTTQYNPFDTKTNAENTKKAVEEFRTNSKDTIEELNKEKNELKYATYLKNVEDISKEKTTLYDKTIGTVQRALGDMLSQFGADEYKYKDKEGKTVFLPTKSQLKQEKVREDYDTGIGKFLGEVGYQGTKILGSTALNVIAPGAGSALYWTDMGASSYKDAINQGASTEGAAAYALANLGFEYATGKLLGGISGKFTGGSARELDKAASNLFNQFTKNTTLSRLLGTAFSEGSEEFVQEYLDNISKLLFIEGNANLGDYASIFADPSILGAAAYSAAIGAATGGLIEGMNGSDVNRNVKLFESFKEQIEERKANTTDKTKIDQYNKVIENIDNYLKKPFSIETETTENVQNKVQEIDESPLANLQKYNEQQKAKIAEQQQIQMQEQQEETNRRLQALENQTKIPTRSTEGMNLMESASRYNIKPETQSAVQNLMENRGIESRWDATRFNDNSVNALWTKDANGNRSVIFNPNASLDTIVEEVAVHELTHDILSSKNTTLNAQEVLNYVKTLQGYNEARQSLENTYATMYDPNSAEFNSLIDEEVVADVLGRKLGNQEFINQLVNSKPSIAKSIYNWVVSKLNSIVNKGKVRSEKLYWENIKNNFENAYKQEYKNNEMASTKYKVTNENGEPITFLRYQKNAMNMSDDFDYNQSDVSHKTGFGINFTDSDMYTKGKDSKDILKSTITAKKGLLTDTNTKVDKKQIDALNKVFNKYIPDVTMFSDNITDGQLIDQINIASELIANAEDNNTGRKAYIEFYNVINKDGYIRTEPDGSKLLSVLSKESIDAFNNTNTNEDIRYSKENAEWNEFLDKNIKNQEERISELNKRYNELDKTREITFDERDNLRKELNDLIRSDNYKNAETKFKEMIKSDMTPNEISKTPEYKMMEQEENIRKRLKDYDADVKYMTDEMSKISEMIENEEKEHRSPDKAIKEAKKIFGITNDYREAGYMLQDGSLLDFSGRNQGSSNYGSRGLDHRDINEIGYDMDEFIELGNIRMKPEAPGFEINIEPTSKQYSALYDYIEYIKEKEGRYPAENSYINVDIEKKGTSRYDTALYKVKTPTSKIINDIKEYYKTGEFPKQSEFMDFYSKKSDKFDKFIDKNIKSTGTTTKLGDIKLPTKQKVSLPTKSTIEAKTSPTEPKKPISKSTLTQAESEELQSLKIIDEAIGLDSEEEARMKFLEKKQQGYVERYSGLKKITDFKEISREYGKYKDLSDFNDKLLKDAEKTIQGYRNTGRRTKAEWLDIAKNIGSNYKGNSEGLTKYAIQSWFEAQPNQKDALNRQGDKYVDFKIQEWVNAVYDGARIGELEKPLVPTVQQPKKETTSIPMVKNNESLRVESQRIANEINKNETFKQKGWLKTATNSDVLKDSGLIKDLDPSQLNYVVQSNKSSVDKANNTINTLGYEKSLDKVKQIINDDKLPSASDVALMQRMIQEAAKRGDTATVQDLIMDTAIVGTDLGQATQALSIIQRLTPEGQLKLYTKLVQRAKVRGEKSFQNVEITPEMVENVLGAYNSDGTYDQDDLNARVEQFKQDLANQMKSTVGDKANAWRYLAMLGNPKTHIRNIVSNLAMNGTIKVKNAMARTLETILPVEERTKTWKPASQDVKEFARQTTSNMKDIITGEAKYNEKSAIESKKQIFKNKALEKLSNFNGNALEAEDWFFSSRAFQSTLQEYLTANGINTYEDIQNNPEIVEKAKNYAKDQAEIATFRQYSKLAATINQIEKKNKGAKLAVQALMPFKKTPINVAKAGVKYSPLGLIKSLSYDAYQLKQGNINASQFIDNLSQGLTGTSLTLLGYALAKAGILSGSGDDDKEGKYDSQLGNTGYSLNIGGNSYSISWLSPVAMPLLVGSNAYEQLEENKDWDMNVVSDTLAKTLDPLNEMSFMQGLTNALQSYGSGVDKIKGSLESTAQNYVGQFFPTIFSQLASTLDDKKRSTKASNDSKYKFGEQTVRSIMYKIPGLRQKLEAAKDIWGNEKEQSDNIIERAFESFIAPYSKTKQIETYLDKEIKRVYNETGETGVIPGIPNSYVKYKDETYRMSANEYTDYKKTYGQTAYNTLNKLINSNDYKQATDEDKVKMLEDVYKYARGKANQEYFDSNNIDYENDLIDKLDTLNDRYGISANTYFANKEEYDYAYQYPEKYTTIKQIAPYNKYTTYKDKITEIKNNTTNDKQETIKYINSLPLSVPQKAMFIKQYYKSFTQYDRQIAEYIAKQNLTRKEKETILKQLGFTIKDGRVYY